MKLSILATVVCLLLTAISFGAIEAYAQMPGLVTEVFIPWVAP